MDNINYILFICVVVPLFLMLFLLEKKARITVGFMILGICMCLLASEINGLMLEWFHGDTYYVTTTITPIIEEVVKALPVLYFAIVFSDKRETLLSISIATGIGFAVLENLVILVGNVDSVSLLWAFIRGFSSGLMHGVCTAAVGLGISFVHKRKKLFYTGTFALLTAAIIYHATFNCLVQSDYRYAGFVLPLITYTPILVFRNQKKCRDKEDDENERKEISV